MTDQNQHPHHAKSARSLVLRKVALGACKIGLLLNFIATVKGIRSREGRSAKVLTICAFIPLILSFIFNVSRLRSFRSRPALALPINVKSRIAPSVIEFGLDILGFLAFLTLLIANGIVIGNFGRGWRSVSSKDILLLSYNSVPWMFLAVIHLHFALHGIASRMKAKLERKGLKLAWPVQATCPDCQRTWRPNPVASQTSQAGAVTDEMLDAAKAEQEPLLKAVAESDDNTDDQKNARTVV